jgi:hypothetical protein
LCWEREEKLALDEKLKNFFFFLLFLGQGFPQLEKNKSVDSGGVWF